MKDEDLEEEELVSFTNGFAESLKLGPRPTIQDLQKITPDISNYEEAQDTLARCLLVMHQRIQALEEALAIEKNRKWYASGGGTLQAGPYATQVEAYNALRYSQTTREKEKRIFPEDAFVWCEQ